MSGEWAKIADELRLAAASDILNAEYDAWIKKLEEIAGHELDPEEWTGRWYDGYTPKEAWEDGPEDGDQ